MKKKHFTFSLAIILFITMSSCTSTRKHYSSESYFVSSYFKMLKLNGKYFMDREDLYEFLNIEADDYVVKYTNKFYGTYKTTGKILGPVSANEVLPQDSLNFIILNYNGKDTLDIVYRDNVFWYKTTYKGKLKEKYFEINLQKKRFPFFPIISRFDIDRIRVGINQSEEIVIHNYSEHWGTFLLFGAHSGGDERAIHLERYQSGKDNYRKKESKPYLIVK